jgi:D-alanine-D-alanine ligase
MKRKNLRVLVVVHEDLVPPDSVEGMSDEEISDFRCEYDVVTALRELKHEVRVVGIGADIDVLRVAVQEFDPHILFNLLVEFDGEPTFDQHVVSFYELMRRHYTGCNPLGLTLARDKALSKKIMAHHHIRVPRFRVFPRGRKVRRPKALEFPLFVKSVVDEASLGIAQASVVRDDEALAERVALIHDSIGSDAIAEEYIEGRELYVGVIGNRRLTVYPIWELFLKNLPDGAPFVATRRVKWDYKYQKRIGLETHRAEGLSPEKIAEIGRAARTAYKVLGLSGYARLDLRMRPDGRFYVIEANPNPDLTYGEDFAETAETAGVFYPQLLQRIIDLGLRYPGPIAH